MDKDRFSSSHPPLPPISEEDQLSLLRLLRSRRVGIVTFYRLLEEHGTAEAALAALPQIAHATGDTEYTCCPEGVALAEINAAKRAGARALWRGAEGYPRRLAEIDDGPPLIWARGPLDADAQPQVAIVGARNASSLGTRAARRLAGELGEAGITIVSGMARGIDTVAHLSSLSTGTIAVIGGGIDVPYPSANAGLMSEIAERGLLFAELPPGTQPRARHFPRRNRIISGMSSAVLVIEAAAKSGSLITAGIAADQGRDVLAVPGHPFDARAAGCNMLIRDGATLIRNTADVIESLGATMQDGQSRPRRRARPAPEQASNQDHPRKIPCGMWQRFTVSCSPGSAPRPSPKTSSSGTSTHRLLWSPPRW